MGSSNRSSAPTVSVIIPAYNAADTLARCVASVQAQAYSRLEIILIDDGSTDDTAKIAATLAASDRRIRVHHQSNQGLSAARNAGIKQATGSYLTFVDADDTIDPALVSTLYHLVEQHQVLLAACNFVTVDASRAVAPLAPFSTTSEATSASSLYSTTAALTAILLEQIPIMSCGKLYHRSLFQKVRFPVGKLYEDVGTTYRLVQQCPKIAYTPAPLYHYYQSPTSIIHQTFSPQKLDLIALTDEMCNTLSIQCNDNVLTNAIQLRRIHARFSILRQVMLVKPATLETRRLTRELVAYLKTHRAAVLQNPVAARRDRLAMLSLLAGLPVFKLAWKFYRH